MSSITISVEDEILQQAQKVAAKKHTTVDGLVREFLRSLSQNHPTAEEEAHAKARREILSMLGTFDVKVGSTPSRARTYADR